MPNVTMPNGDVVAFPDSMPKEQIRGLIASKFPEVAPKPQQPEQSVGRTALEQGLQGASFGFADELTDRLGAGIASVATGEKYGDLLKEARQNTGERFAQQFEQNPVTSIGANIGGALLTGGAGASTKAGTAIGNSLRTGNLGARVAKGAIAGAASGGLYGAGASADDKRLEGAAQGAALGGVVGGAIPAVGAGLKAAKRGVQNELQSLSAANPQTSDALRKAARPLYDRFTNSGASYSNKLTDELANIADSLKSKGIAGSLKKSDEVLNDTLDFYAQLRGKSLSPSDIQALDQSLADDVARFNKAGEYNFGRLVNNLKYELRDRAFDANKASAYVTGGSPTAVNDLIQGNKLWSQSYKTADIEKVLKKAQGTDNPQTAIRTGLKNLLANDKKMAGYSADEKKALEEALKRGGVGGLIKLFGGRLTDSMAGGIAGMSAAGAPGAIAGSIAGKAVGGGMANIAGGIQANRLNSALQQIQSGGGKALAPITPTSAVGAVPAGAAAGALSAERPQRLQVEVNPTSGNPMPKVEVPQLAPQSNAGDLFQRIAQAESGGNPNAKAKTSSASGLYQFTNDTWNAGVQRWGKELGLTHKDKNDPDAQHAMMQKLVESNSKYIKTKLGKEPDGGDIYLAHFMGAPAAVKLLQYQGTGASAPMLFPKAAKANQSIFFNKGRPRSVEEVYQIVTSKVGEA